MVGTDNTGGADARRRHSWIEGIRRLTRYRLMIPLKRSIHSPVHTARGVMVGVAWAMTPTIGLQMPLVFVTWLITRRLFRWDFSVVIGMVWTWATNVVTMVPAYYAFYVTGQFMLGRSDAGMTGYGEFQHLMDRALDAGADAGWFEWKGSAFSAIIHGWGVPMAVGCIPWSIAAGWVSYVWTLKFVHKYRAVRAHRRQMRLAADAPPPVPPGPTRDGPEGSNRGGPESGNVA